MLNPDAMDGIDPDWTSGLNDEVCSDTSLFFFSIECSLYVLQDISPDILMENLNESFSLLEGSEVLPTRVLDDAFHFMDRLLRLLSKKHSAFKAFAHDFSEAIGRLGVCETCQG